MATVAPPPLTAHPPGPHGLPLLGNLPEFSRDVLGFLERASRDYGDIVRLNLAGWPTYFIFHPDLCENVLVTNHRNFIKHRFFWRHVGAIFGQGLLLSEGDFWLRQRRLAAPAFHHERLAGYANVMVDYTERMLESWKPGDVRDAHAEMMGVTMQIAAKTLFDADVTQDIRTISDAFADVIEEIMARYRRPFPIPDRLPLPGNLRYTRAVRKIDALVLRVIRERRDAGEDRGDLLSMLLAARDDDGEPMTEKQLRDEVITLFLAGHETTAIALSWTWWLLSRHPEIEAKLHAEVDGVLSGRAPTFADLARLAYTERVVSESMRLYPPAWGIGRETVRPCEIAGYRIPAGAMVFMAPWVTHRDARWYDRPNQFLPERWENDFARTLPRFAYMPFGGGPRLCIGNRFAMMEAVLVLATVARRYRLEWQRDRPVVPYPSITLRPGGGVYTRVVAR
jgi:cytochrome P450